MSSIQPPPIINPVIDESGIATLPWILFFGQIFSGDTGTSWTPSFTNLTTVGTPTITGRYYKIGSLVYFSITITPSTSTSSTAGSTYVNNFPLDVITDGACFAVSGLVGGPVGMVEASTNRIYVPDWSAVTVPLTVIGLVEAR
jgi:hypothetical protein